MFVHLSRCFLRNGRFLEWTLHRRLESGNRGRRRHRRALHPRRKDRRRRHGRSLGRQADRAGQTQDRPQAHQGRDGLQDGPGPLRGRAPGAGPHAEAHTNLGNAFYEQKRAAEAIAAYQKAIEVDPKFANAHGALGLVLLREGSFAEAAAAIQRALDLLPAGHPLRAVAQRQQKQCQQLLALEKRLPLVLENKERAGPDESLALAQMCQEYKKRHASAVRLYQEAFQAQPRHVFGGRGLCLQLKNLKRATVVGEATGGGAHPGDTQHVDDHFSVFVPTGRIETARFFACQALVRESAFGLFFLSILLRLKYQFS